ncbi:MAG: gluconate permease [Planctomycetales bacterium]|nr:gluconate permease [Planctomycetales bacterium]
MHPLLILLIGTLVVVASIVWLRIGAFFGLMLSAFVVSFLAPGELTEKIPRALEELGNTAGKISLIIACAAVVGKCMTDSGAADRIVRSFLKLFGETRTPIALMTSGFVLSVPVFFDTVFYLLVPLARSLHRRTKQNYLLYILAIASGAAITHTLVPPTPGPLAMAENLNFDVGIMIIMGTIVAVPCSVVTLFYAHWAQQRFEIPMRPISGDEEFKENAPEVDEARLPSFFESVLPIVLPVLLIAANTIVTTLAKSAEQSAAITQIVKVTGVLGHASLALVLSACVALLLYVKYRAPSRSEIQNSIETALMSAGVIILITAAGGAFGAMLKEAQVGPVIENLFSGNQTATGITLLLIAWVTASLLKISQGSGTVAMITASSIVASMIDPSTLEIHPVYLATAIGSGSLCVSWMNDSGFWIVARMSGLTEVETLKTWTISLIILSIVGLIVTIVLATLLPMPIEPPAPI